MAKRIEREILEGLNGVFGTAGFELSSEVLGGENGEFPDAPYERTFYSRGCNSGRQKFWIDSYRDPGDDPGVVRFSAEYQLVFPEFDEFAASVAKQAGVEDRPEDLGSGEFWGSIGYLGPDENYIAWSGSAEESERLVNSIAEYSRQWVLPFFDDFRSLHDVIDGIEAKDPRITRGVGPGWYVTVAIAYDYLGRRSSAAEFLRDSVAKFSVIRRLYDPVVAWYLESSG